MNLFAIYLMQSTQQMVGKPIYYTPEYSQYQMQNRMLFLKDTNARKKKED